jgi:hypothetical protein
MAGLAVSCFGKLPFHREFLRVGLGTPAAGWVVRWVEGAHAAWTSRGDAPAETSLVRFAAAPEGGGLVAGVVRQSSDGLRRHPVTFFIEDAREIGGADWHLLPLGLATAWHDLDALGTREWDGVETLTAALESGIASPDWDGARAARRDALATRLSEPSWAAVTGASGDAGRHLAANLVAVAEAQRDARSEAEGVSVALPLPAGAPGVEIRSAFWLELLAMAVGSTAHRPAIVVGTAPSRLVAFYRSPEGPDLAAVLSSLDMAPIDDVAEPWQALPPEGSARARAVESIVESRGAETLEDVLRRLGSVVSG